MPSRRATFAALAALVLAAALYLTQIQPGSFRPVDTAAIAQDAQLPVFAYGTLKNPAIRFVVTLSTQDERPARLAGWAREGRDIDPAPGAATEGVVFDVTPRELRRLDRYERLGTLYRRIPVTLEDGTAAWAYDRLAPPAPGGQ